MDMAYQRNRCRPHHTAAAATVVLRYLIILQGHERGKARVPRCSAGIELRYVHQPGIDPCIGLPGTPFLGMEPVHIGVSAIRVDAAHDPPQTPPRHPQQDARRGEERHLGIVRNQGKPAPPQRIPGNAPLTVSPGDARPRIKLDGIAQGIAHGAAHHTSEDLVPGPFYLSRIVVCHIFSLILLLSRP